MTGHEGEVYTVAFHPDGATLASCSSDGTVRLWDPSDAQATHKLTGHKGAVYTVAFAGHDELLSASADRTTKVWNVKERKERWTLPAHKNEVYAVASTPDGSRWATAGKDHIVRVLTGTLPAGAGGN